MNKLFLDVIHENEVLNEATLETLKGGSGGNPDCPNLVSCGCYQGNGNICAVNKMEPDPPTPSGSTPPTGPTTPNNP